MLFITIVSVMIIFSDSKELIEGGNVGTSDIIAATPDTNAIYELFKAACPAPAEPIFIDSVCLVKKMDKYKQDSK